MSNTINTASQAGASAIHQDAVSNNDSANTPVANAGTVAPPPQATAPTAPPPAPQGVSPMSTVDPQIAANPFGSLNSADVAVQLGSQVDKMMSDASALMTATDANGQPDTAKQMLGEQLMQQATNLQDMASKLLAMMSDMEKTIIQNLN